MKKIVILLGLIFISIFSMAQTMHVVIFCDTDDPKIGENKEAEERILKKELDIISDVISDYGYDTEYFVYDGASCSKSNLLSKISKLEVGPKDIVFFYYGGHGTRAVNDSDPFPQMCLGEDFQDDFVPLTLVKNMVLKKNPRLSLIISGCCNKEHPSITIKTVVAEGSYTKEANIDKNAIKKMFVDTEGVLEFTSSRAGEYSYSSKDGGVFCILFWNLMEELWAGNLQSDWDVFCKTVCNEVQKVPINSIDGIVHQTPYYEFNGKSTQNSTTNRKTQTTVTINGQSSTLTELLNKLSDQTFSPDVRLAMIPEIKRQHFASDAKVITIGCDMKTMVDYEDVDTFLRRVALSPFIKQISIVEGDGAGKKSQIKVHELHK